MDLLKEKASKHLTNGALVLVPLPEANQTEQEYCLLKHTGDGQFDVIESIMKTAFSQRVDRQGLSEKDMDNEYFEGM